MFHSVAILIVNLSLVIISNATSSMLASLRWQNKPELNSPNDYIVQGATFGYLNSTKSYYYIGGDGPYEKKNDVYRWNIQQKNWKRLLVQFYDGFYLDADQSIIINDTFYIFNPYNQFKYNGEVWTFDGYDYYRYTATQVEAEYPISFGCSVTNGSHVFVIGGAMHIPQYSQHVQLFDLLTMKYLNPSNFTSMPIPILHHTCQYYSPTNSIYVFGGYTESSVTCNSIVDAIYKFDITNNSWTKLDSKLSSPRGYLMSVMRTVNNTDYIYLIGGRTLNCSTLDTVDIFELQTENCYISIDSTLSQPVESAAIFLDQFGLYINQILLLGGKNNNLLHLYKDAYIAPSDGHADDKHNVKNIDIYIIVSVAIGILIIVTAVIIYHIYIYVLVCIKPQETTTSMSSLLPLHAK